MCIWNNANYFFTLPLFEIKTMPTKKTKSSQSPISIFENSLQELESLVEQMEHGNLSLDETLHHFEKGVKLTNLCQKALSDAEQKIELLQSKVQKLNTSQEEE